MQLIFSFFLRFARFFFSGKNACFLFVLFITFFRCFCFCDCLFVFVICRVGSRLSVEFRDFRNRLSFCGPLFAVVHLLIFKEFRIAFCIARPIVFYRPTAVCSCNLQICAISRLLPSADFRNASFILLNSLPSAFLKRRFFRDVSRRRIYKTSFYILTYFMRYFKLKSVNFR